MSSYNNPEEVIDDALTLGEDHIVPPAYKGTLAGQKGPGQFVYDVGKGTAEDLANIVRLPKEVMGENPHLAGSEEADYFNAVNENKSQRWIPKIVELMASGGLANAMKTGGKNVLGTFGGRLSATADKVALKKAEEMAAAGASREEIIKATGWFQKGDKQWRYEIPDWKSALRAGQQRTIGDKLYHPDLFQAYPKLRKTNIIYDQAPGEGGFNTRTGNIHLPKDGQVTEENRATILHELQHAIQRRESFAPGGSPEGMAIQAAQFRRNLGVPPDAAADYGLGHTWYKDLMGEVEARNVATRMGSDPKRLVRNYPWMTEGVESDIPEKAQIILDRTGQITGEHPAAKVARKAMAERIAAARGAKTEIMTQRQVGDPNPSVHAPPQEFGRTPRKSFDVQQSMLADTIMGPVDPSFSQLPVSENIEDWRDAPPGTLVGQPALTDVAPEYARAAGLEALKRQMSAQTKFLVPGQLEKDIGAEDTTWKNVYDQMEQENRRPTEGPIVVPRTAEEHKKFMGPYGVGYQDATQAEQAEPNFDELV
jgi:hypothetical protein